MKDLIKNSEHTVTISGYTSYGFGVARIGEHVVFVGKALRGEVCRIRIVKVLRSAAYAKLIGVITASRHRITPACNNFGKCGGCDFLHMDYAEELELKRQRVEDALRRIGGFDISVPDVVGSDHIEAYRNKAVYAVGEANGHAVAGFYKERSHDIVTADECVIQSDVSGRAAKAVTRWMDEFNINPYDELTRTGSIRRVFSRFATGTNSAQVALVAANRRIPHLDKLVSRVSDACPETSSILLNVNKTRGNTILSGDFHVIWGDSGFLDELCGLNFRVSPLSFYQINHGQAEKLYYKAVEYAALTKDDTVLDLYCGAGTISLLLARYAGRVIGAEIIPGAVADARKNAGLNNIDNAEFICADAFTVVTSLEGFNAAPAVVVLDPPRRGLSADEISAVAGLEPERIVYVSCDPATLARDLKVFRGLGYSLTDVTPFDMFPRCAHIECCCKLTLEYPAVTLER